MWLLQGSGKRVITKFGHLYAGHVDMENLGFNGTPADDRLYSNEHLVSVFEKAETLAQLMNKTGYDTLWLAEHHFQVEGYECIPNILMLSVDLAHRVERIRFACGFNVTPTWHPLRLAEDFATADILTGGRVIFGVGRGYHSREVETFGAPLIDRNANRDLFEEQVEIIFKAFSQDSFSHHGKHYDIPPSVPYRGYELEEITLVPRPLNLPVETWQPIVSGNQRGLDFMAKHGIKGIVGGGTIGEGTSHEVIQTWQRTLARHGRETRLGEDLILEFNIYLADTVEQAKREAQVLLEENMKVYAPLGMVPELTEEQIRSTADPRQAVAAGLPNIDDAMGRGGWLCGPPELIGEALMEVQEKYPGVEEIHVHNAILATPMSVELEQLEWFGNEVIPMFKRQAAAMRG